MNNGWCLGYAQVERVGLSPIVNSKWWNGPAADLKTRAKRGAWTVQAPFSQQRNDFMNALEEMPGGGRVVFGYVGNSRPEIVARLRGYDDAHYSMLASA